MGKHGPGHGCRSRAVSTGLSCLPRRSQSALSVVQAAYAAFGQGDLPGLLALCTPETEWWTNGEEAGVPWAGLNKGQENVVTGYFQVSFQRLHVYAGRVCLFSSDTRTQPV